MLDQSKEDPAKCFFLILCHEIGKLRLDHLAKKLQVTINVMIQAPVFIITHKVAHLHTKCFRVESAYILPVFHRSSVR